MKVVLINYDNGSRVPVMPQNLYHLKTCLEWAGHKVTVEDFNLTKHPYSDLHLCTADVFGLGFISGYWPHYEAIKIAEVINKHCLRKNFKFIIGGHGPSAAPEYYLNKLSADAVFCGAADHSLPAWLAGNMNTGVFESIGYDLTDLNHHQVSRDPGINVYKRISFPNTKVHEFGIQILSGRGCPYKCAFCFRMGEGYKRYSIHEIAEVIEWYYYVEGITHFQFSDELLMSSGDHCKDICDGLIDLQRSLNQKLYFDCNGRLNIAAKHPWLLGRMKQAGFRYINYGCESMSQEVLDNINKKQTVKQIRMGIKNTIEAGISPGLNFMWGNPGDTEDTLLEAANFIIAHNDGTELRTIRPMTPYPGTELFKRLDITVDEFYEEHVNSDLFSYHFMDMTNEKANALLASANKELYKQFNCEKMRREMKHMTNFYHGNVDPSTFRGFREV